MSYKKNSAFDALFNFSWPFYSHALFQFSSYGTITFRQYRFFCKGRFVVDGIWQRPNLTNLSKRNIRAIMFVFLQKTIFKVLDMQLNCFFFKLSSNRDRTISFTAYSCLSATKIIFFSSRYSAKTLEYHTDF